jgi:hypothetical protein
MKRVLVVILASLSVACSGGGPPVAPVDERNDVERLQNALTEDPAQLVLEEIDQAIATDRPVMAADLIDTSAIPAVRRHVDSVQALDMSTSSGRTYRSRAVRLLRHRLTALEHWRDALARGVGHEDETLLSAIHENAEAEHELFELHRELAIVRPLRSGPAPRTTEEESEALPDIAPPAPPSDDDPEPPPPEPDPHAADPIDGTEELDEPVLPPGYHDPDDHHDIVPRH